MNMVDAKQETRRAGRPGLEVALRYLVYAETWGGGAGLLSGKPRQ